MEIKATDKIFISHGIDLVEVSRIEAMIQRHGIDGLSRLFTEKERSYAIGFKKNPAERLAGRYAVKEAVLKLLGKGLRDGLEMTDIETTNDPLGKPLTTLSGETAKLASQLGITALNVSISHTAGLAFASVVGYKQ